MCLKWSVLCKYIVAEYVKSNILCRMYRVCIRCTTRTACAAISIVLMVCRLKHLLDSCPSWFCSPYIINYMFVYAPISRVIAPTRYFILFLIFSPTFLFHLFSPSLKVLLISPFFLLVSSSPPSPLPPPPSPPPPPYRQHGPL